MRSSDIFNLQSTILTHCGREKMATFLQMTFSSAFSRTFNNWPSMVYFQELINQIAPHTSHCKLSYFVLNKYKSNVWLVKHSSYSSHSILMHIYLVKLNAAFKPGTHQKTCNYKFKMTLQIEALKPKMQHIPNILWALSPKYHQNFNIRCTKSPNNFIAC